MIQHHSIDTLTTVWQTAMSILTVQNQVTPSLLNRSVPEMDSCMVPLPPSGVLTKNHFVVRFYR